MSSERDPLRRRSRKSPRGTVLASGIRVARSGDWICMGKRRKAMRRLIFVFAAAAAFAPVGAQALTVRDIVELSRAGLGEETLLALIEVDPSVFPIDTATLKSLKDAGVSERVIVAMVRSARTPAPVAEPLAVAEAPAAAPQPQVVVLDHHDAAPQVREVPVAVPIYIPVSRHRRDYGDRGEVRDDSGKRRRNPEPVYWGFGGKLRPDAWQPK